MLRLLSRKTPSVRICTLGFVAFFFVAANSAVAQQADTTRKQSRVDWFKQLNIRGYAQLRYNRLLETNPDLSCEQCDKSWGGGNGFFFRRIRVILYGQIHKRVYVYIQPDFASSPASGSNHFAQIRDAYFDVGLDRNNQFRLRFGQSKVPYGFENMQSSQNRLPLDRADGLNSAVANERDIGVFAYWAPTKVRERFAHLVSSGLKGSGDYGVVGFGVYNGQTANRNEQNDVPTVVARVSYPFQIGKQIIEPGLQAYAGRTVVTGISEHTRGTDPNYEYDDRRVAASFIIYPQPFGFSAEYNIGTGPEYSTETFTIEQKRLQGGYALASYQKKFGEQVLTPFARYHYYNGGKKHELDARSYHVKEFEIGAEWQPMKAFEVTAMYTISQRRFEDGVTRDNFQKGNLLRLQFQVNF